MCQGFGSKRERCAGMASVRRHQELPPCWTATASASSKTDPLLPKAEPVSDAGGASVTTFMKG